MSFNDRPRQKPGFRGGFIKVSMSSMLIQGWFQEWFHIDRHEGKMGLPPEGSLHASDLGHVHVHHHTWLSFPLQIGWIMFGEICEFDVL